MLADALNASGGLCPLSGQVYTVSRSTQNHWSVSSEETFSRHGFHLKVQALLHQESLAKFFSKIVFPGVLDVYASDIQ